MGESVGELGHVTCHGYRKLERPCAIAFPPITSGMKARMPLSWSCSVCFNIRSWFSLIPRGIVISSWPTRSRAGLLGAEHNLLQKARCSLAKQADTTLGRSIELTFSRPHEQVKVWSPAFMIALALVCRTTLPLPILEFETSEHGHHRVVFGFAFRCKHMMQLRENLLK